MANERVKAYWWKSFNESLSRYQKLFRDFEQGEGANRARLALKMEAELADAVSKMKIYRSIIA